MKYPESIATADAAKLAFRFVLVIGIANLFADMTYEGARGINGQFLGSLGTSATMIGFIAGFGELLGYGLLSISGYFADKSHQYWAFIFYGICHQYASCPGSCPGGQLAHSSRI